MLTSSPVTHCQGPASLGYERRGALWVPRDQKQCLRYLLALQAFLVLFFPFYESLVLVPLPALANLSCQQCRRLWCVAQGARARPCFYSMGLRREDSDDVAMVLNACAVCHVILSF